MSALFPMILRQVYNTIWSLSFPSWQEVHLSTLGGFECKTAHRSRNGEKLPLSVAVCPGYLQKLGTRTCQLQKITEGS